MYINGTLTANSSLLPFNISGSAIQGPNFFIGGRDDNWNGWYNHAWRGYIAEFKLQHSTTLPCLQPPIVPGNILWEEGNGDGLWNDNGASNTWIDS